MAEVTVFTADRMLAIESGTVVDGTVDGSGHLILTTHGGTPIDAGNVVGPPGSDATGGSSVAYQDTPPATPAVGDVWVDSNDILSPATVPTGYVPVGGILAFGGSAAPMGWQICDGSVSETADLIAVVGANVPDLRGKFILGVSASHVAGSIGGEETHTLVTAEMPAHAHGGATHGDPAISNGFLRVVAVVGGTIAGNTMPGYASGSYVDYTGGAFPQHYHNLSSDGGGGAHNNMPPFYALIYIIRSTP